MLKFFKLETVKFQRCRVSVHESITRDYLNYGFGLTTLSEKYSMSEEDMVKTLKDLNIPIRRERKNFTSEDIETIKRLKSSKIKTMEIAKIVGCNVFSLYRIYKKHNI